MRINFGKSFRIAQEMRGVTNQQLMDDFGVFRQQVHRWRSNPSITLEKAERFAEYFGMDVLEMLKLGQGDDSKKTD